MTTFQRWDLSSKSSENFYTKKRQRKLFTVTTDLRYDFCLSTFENRNPPKCCFGVRHRYKFLKTLWRVRASSYRLTSISRAESVREWPIDNSDLAAGTNLRLAAPSPLPPFTACVPVAPFTLPKSLTCHLDWDSDHLYIRPTDSVILQHRCCRQAGLSSLRCQALEQSSCTSHLTTVAHGFPATS